MLKVLLLLFGGLSMLSPCAAQEVEGSGKGGVRRFSPTGGINRYRNRVYLGRQFTVGCYMFTPFVFDEVYHDFVPGNWVRRNWVVAAADMPINSHLTFQPSFIRQDDQYLRSVNFLGLALMVTTWKLFQVEKRCGRCRLLYGSKGFYLHDQRRLPMSVSIDILNPSKPKRVAVIASNAAVSQQTGWPIGFWWAELTHPYWKFVEHGYQVDLYSPDGGKLVADDWSDPRDASKYSADDLISLGFICSPEHSKLVANSKPISQLRQDDYDALLFVGGQGPMYTFFNDNRVHDLASSFYKLGKITAVLCHATCILLKTKLDGKLIVAGKTWTGFANSEEDFADSYVGKRIQPFRIEDEARKLTGTNFIVSGRFKAHAVRDGNLITGQQQFSGGAVAQLVIEALGV